ncbi:MULTISPECIES: PadR family transcriptional regulator [unclassified Microbacterium]|uniref:PadR family transcriptional regulator n=1 Tax=unclassified Microbacterium TaxID=2609290 RepID=UPI0037472AE4
MSGSFMGDAFGGRGRGGAGQGWPTGGIWDAMEQLRTTFEQKVGSGAGTTSPNTRMGRGDVRAAVLALLAETPMHGYQIIQQIEERSGGTWKPSPGSVYPTLQLLADEGLIQAEESNGRKTYSLTEEGRQVANAETDRTAPWENSGRENPRAGALPKAGIDLAQAVAQVGRSGNPEQVKKAIDVLDEARRKIFAILAQD